MDRMIDEWMDEWMHGLLNKLGAGGVHLKLEDSEKLLLDQTTPLK